MKILSLTTQSPNCGHINHERDTKNIEKMIIDLSESDVRFEIFNSKDHLGGDVNHEHGLKNIENSIVDHSVSYCEKEVDLNKEPQISNTSTRFQCSFCDSNYAWQNYFGYPCETKTKEGIHSHALFAAIILQGNIN